VKDPVDAAKKLFKAKDIPNVKKVGLPLLCFVTSLRVENE
jgi:hypothetical protein